ncbi:Calnexin [Heterocephalus glaber]|uniref:Calnexin n=1 Tax=Heterocephalus glaber TaxID=10181 RepID=G5B7K2_HETGA|nr:Calnexin [Heterocephalus glaber]
MEGKWLLCILLVLGTAVVWACDGHDDDMIDIEDDLDDVIEEVDDSKSKPDTSTPPPSPKVTYKAPVPTGEVYFADSFDRGSLSGWILSKAKKDDTDDEIAKYDGKWEADEMKEMKLPGDNGLVLISQAKHHTISAKLNKPFGFDTRPLIVHSEQRVVDDWASDGWGLKKAANGAAEPGMVGQMLKVAEEHPWLWVVYLLTVALPVFLVILFCCSGKKQSSAMEYKKTDAPQPDVKKEEEKEEEKDKGDDEEEGEEKLEEKQKSDVEEDGGTVSQEEEDRKPKAEEDEILNRSPRNRKP